MGAILRVEAGPEGVTYFRMARTLLGRPLYWTGCYLVDDLLVDAGPPALARELARAVADRPVGGLVITHHHEDHSGGAPRLARERGLAPRIHKAGVTLLEDGFAVEPYRRLAWGGSPEPWAPEPLGDVVTSRGMRFEVIETPGHSPDHVCLFEPERGLLFTGDLFLAERLRFLRADEDLGALIGSLKAVARLPAKHVLCAHRGPLPDGPASLRRKADHLEALREGILALLGKGVAEPEITRRLVGPEGFLTLASLGHFSARNFVRAVARESLR